MVMPIIILVAIPVFLGIVVVSPFDQPEEPKNEIISEEPNDNILYFVLTLIWIVVLMRILLQIKKGAFKVTQRY
jgi:hypothetical protein